MMLLNSFRTLHKFCSTKLPTTVPHHLGDNTAFAHDFPKTLNQQAIMKLLDPTCKDITKVQLILNKLGLATGKAIVHFRDKQLMEKYTRKYDQDFITIDKGVHKILLRPIAHKDKTEKIDDKYRVRLYGLDYDTNEQEIWKIARDFGQVAKIDMVIRPNGLNTGKATVIFKQRKSMMDFLTFADGMEINGRKVKASLQTSLKEAKEQVKKLQLPRKNMEANYRLYMESLKNKQTKQEV